MRGRLRKAHCLGYTLHIACWKAIILTIYDRCSSRLAATPSSGRLSPATFSRKGRRDAPPPARDMRAAAERAIGRASSRKIAGRRCASSLFHVKQGSASRPIVDLLARWRSKTNLIAESTFPSVWTRHIADSRAAPRPCARGQALGRHGFRGRLSRPRDRNPARRRSRRRRPLHRKRPAQVRFPARGGPRHRGRGDDPRRSGSRRSTPRASELWTPSPRAPSPPCR